MKIGIAAVLVLLFVCCGAAAGTNLIQYGTDFLTDDSSSDDHITLGTNSPFYGKANYDSATKTLTLNSNAVVELVSSLGILGGVTNEIPDFTIDLNGGVIQRKSDAPGSFNLISISSGSGLNLTDNSNISHYFNTTTTPWELDDENTGKANATSLDAIIENPSLLDSHPLIKVTGGVITGGSSDTGGNGGGVYIGGGTFTMTGGNIIGNSASAYGGGVYVYSSGTFTMKGGSITGNSATDSSGEGGGVYVTGTNSKFTMSGGSIVGNSATGSNCEGGGVYVSSGEFTMSGGSIVGNSAGFRGGGVHIGGGTFTMKGDASIKGNSATYGGGGVYVASGKFTMSETASITRNSATYGGGGGVYVASGEFTMSETARITGNSATYGSGGGVYVGSSGTFEMSGGSITENTVRTNGYGGGVYNSGTFNVSGMPDISGNKAGNPGADNNVYLYEGKTITVTGALTSGAYIGIINPLSDETEFAQGSASYTVNANDAQYFYADDETTPLKAVVADSTKTFAESKLEWGKKMVAKIGTIEYATVADAVNTASEDQIVEMIDDSSEPMINIPSGTTITLDLNGHVLNHTGSSGSVIKIEDGGNLTVKDTSTSNNKHYFTVQADGTWKLDDTKKTNAIPLDQITDASQLTSDSIIEVTGGVITGNGGGGDGGGVYNEGTFTMEGGNIVGNSASIGGGVYNDGTFEMSGTAKIIGNHATGTGGGGVYVSNDKTFTMSGNASVTGNTASYGGGVYNDGGGVYNSQGTFTMSDNASVTGNSATDSGAHGGGVYNYMGTFEMSGNASVTGNTASYGGGVYNEGGDVYNPEGTFEMSGGIITKNSADTGGGGVYNSKGTFEMSGGKITKNSADTGGGVCVESGTFKVKDAPVISDNTKSDKTTVNNVHLNTGIFITLVGALEDVAYIGIINPLEKNVPIGVSGGSYEISDVDAARFHSDKDELTTAKTDGNELSWGSETPTPAPSSPSSSSRSYGTSIWLTATPTPTPTVEATPEPTLAQPTASPIKTPTQTPASPAPLAAVIAGLGAAGVFFGVRRK